MTLPRGHLLPGPHGGRPLFPLGTLQTSAPLCCVPQELLDALRREKLNLEQTVSELQANVSRLEEQARELKERERLLVFFPELHVPVETQFESKGEGRSTRFPRSALVVSQGIPPAPDAPALFVQHHFSH